MKAGKLDDRITIQQRSVTQEINYGTSVESWSDLDEVWADVQDMLPSRGERIADGIDVARRPARVRIRYRDDVDSTMRVQHNGLTYRIVTQPAELGRREGLEFVMEQLTTEGQAP